MCKLNSSLDKEYNKKLVDLIQDKSQKFPESLDYLGWKFVRKELPKLRMKRIPDSRIRTGVLIALYGEASPHLPYVRMGPEPIPEPAPELKGHVNGPGVGVGPELVPALSIKSRNFLGGTL